MKSLNILAALIILLCIVACSTEFDLNSDYKEIAVIYGLLDIKQDEQYIRITRAVIDEDTPAPELAQNAELLYFQNEEVVIKEYTSSSKNNLLNTFTLDKVNAADPANGIPGKEEGFFVDDPYWVYRLDEGISRENYYVLELTTDDGNLVTAETEPVDTFVVTRPKTGQNFNLLAEVSTIKWQPAPNGVIYDCELNFTYREEANNDPSDFEIKTLVMNIFRNLDGDNPQFLDGSVITFPFKPEDFYAFLANNTDATNASDFKRIAESVSLTFYAGGKELQNLYEVNLSQQSGLTGGSVSPSYTNIDEGLGILSSRVKLSVFPDIAPAVIERLVCGDVTSDLGFDSGDVTLNCD